MAYLIDKDALVAEIDKRESILDIDSAFGIGGMIELKFVKDILNTLEVKEVDLEKEADEMWNYVFSELGWDENTRMTITHKEFMALAKHFFELGLKVKQG